MKRVWLVIPVFLAACTPSTDAPPEPAVTDPSTAAHAVPGEAASIRGVVTSVEGGRVLVEEEPDERSGSAKAWVEVTDGTRILRRSGAVAVRADLVRGRRVSVWFTGPVRESYPVQAAAGTIVIEP